MIDIDIAKFPHVAAGYSDDGVLMTVKGKHIKLIMELQLDLQEMSEKMQPQIDGYWKLIRQCQDRKEEPPHGLQQLVYSLEGEQRAYLWTLKRINEAISGKIN